MADYLAFKTEWLGRRVIDPLLIGHGETVETAYQCVTLIKQYWTECYSLVINHPGNAIDIWYRPPAALLDHFYRVESSEAQAGDIVVLHTLGHNDDTQPGHVGIATGSIDSSSVDILEQNGATGGGTGTGGDAIRTRYVPRSRVAGCWRPRVPATPTPPPRTDNYQALSAPQSYTVTANSHEWNIDYSTMEDISAHPVADIYPGETFMASGVNHKLVDGKTVDYYMKPENFGDAGNSQEAAHNIGIHHADIIVTPPAPAPRVFPAGAVPYPGDKTPYTVIKRIPAYQTATNAGNHFEPKGTIEPGDYFIYNVYPGNVQLINLTPVIGKPGNWINKDDNQPDPPPEPPPVVLPMVEEKERMVANRAPTPDAVPVVVAPKPEVKHDTEAMIRTSLHWFQPSHEPIDVAVLKTVMMTEMFGRRHPITLHSGDEHLSYGVFTRDGKPYALFRLRSDEHFEFFYGVPVNSALDLKPYLFEVFSYADKLKSGIQNSSAYKWIDGFIKPKPRRPKVTK